MVLRCVRRPGRGTVLMLALACLVGLGSPATASPRTATPVADIAAARASAHVRIEGNGSSWSANAVNQWIADVESQGLQVVYTATGSAQGRKDFGYRNNDYAVTDIPFQGVDSVTGEVDSPLGRPYAYLPIVAGGTSFPYQIRVGGKLVRNLRLSGRTVAKIFTNQITNWNDPAIRADNNGRVLPSLTITPVVHSEGSGSTAQFTRYLAKMFPDIWGPFNGGTARMTEYFPRKGKQVAQNGSDGVMNYIASAAANGTIGYDEYSYALNKGYPVAKIQNANGYFTLPDQYNVAVALTKAEINEDPNSPEYLIQNLDKVYTYADDRTYPLSSYSYLVLPTGKDTEDTRLRGGTAKRQTLVDFLYYSICTGQREMGPIGYSPLPVNLVQAGFNQIQKLKVADPGVDIQRRDISSCNNPTFIAGKPNENYLAKIAPKPPACDKVGAGPCAEGGGRPAGGGSGGGGSGGGGSGGGGSTTPSPGASGAPGTVTVDPDTGQVIGSGTENSSDVAGVATELAASRGSGLGGVLGPLAVIELLAILIAPVLISRRLGRRRSSS